MTLGVLKEQQTHDSLDDLSRSSTIISPWAASHSTHLLAVYPHNGEQSRDTLSGGHDAAHRSLQYPIDQVSGMSTEMSS